MTKRVSSRTHGAPLQVSTMDYDDEMVSVTLLRRENPASTLPLQYGEGPMTVSERRTRRSNARKSYKFEYDEEIDFGDEAEEAEDDEEEEDDDEEGGGRRRRRRKKTSAVAARIASTTAQQEDDEGPLVDEVLGRRWIIPELEALAELRSRRKQASLWLEEDRSEARRWVAELSKSAETLKARATKLEQEAAASAIPSAHIEMAMQQYRARLAAFEKHNMDQQALLRATQDQAQAALGELAKTQSAQMSAYQHQLASAGCPPQQQHMYLSQLHARFSEQSASLAHQWNARLHEIQGSVMPHPGPPPSGAGDPTLLMQAQALRQSATQHETRMRAIKSAAEKLGIDLEHRKAHPAETASSSSAAAAAAAPTTAPVPGSPPLVGGGKDIMEGVPEEDLEDGARVPSFAEPHWSYLVKLRDRAYCHSRWLPETEVEEDNPPYSRSTLQRWLRKMRDEAALKGADVWEGDVQPHWDRGVHPRAEDASLALCSWSLEDFVDPETMEVEKILAAASDDGTPPQGSSVDVLERHAWSRQLLRIIEELERFRIAGYRAASPFMQPVDPERDGAPGYFEAIKHPVDLGTIKARLRGVPPPGAARPLPPYSGCEEAARDISQVWVNCRLYTQDPTHDIRILSDTLEAEWHRLWERATRRVALLGGRWMYLYQDGGIPRKLLVKWKARSYSKCTWEREEDVDDDDAVARYLEINRVPDKVRPRPTQYPGGAPPTAVYSTSKDYKGRELRSYQLEGLNWLIYSWRNRRNCILADEMGLGKTAQAAAFLDHLFHMENDRGPFLVVVPLTTIPHWQREFAAWTNFRVCTYHDSQGGRDTREFIKTYEWFYYTRSAQGSVMRFRDQFKFDVLLTTYEVCIADEMDIREVPWSLLIVDEGQRLKNKANKLQQTLEHLSIERRLLLTGTPLQNNISELWALLNFVEPVKFGSHASFMAEFGDLRTTQQVERLTEVMRPHVLRRRKEDVEKSIPKKEETVVDVELTMMQKQYYRALFERNRAFLSRASAGSVGQAKKQAVPALLNLETELRKCCNHVFLIKGAEERETSLLRTFDDRMKTLVSSSGKMVLIDKLLPKLQAEGHKVLIFSQMTRMLDLLELYCKWRHYPMERIDGSIRGNARQAAIDRFSDPESNSFVFLLSTRAGGVGITLTAADTVIIFDSDWNPQNDVQAQARAHRIGQTKQVKIYRLVTKRTYEATMFERASRKLGLEQAVMGGSVLDHSAVGGKRSGPSKDEIERLLREGAYGALTDDEETSAQASRLFEESDIDALLARGSRVVTIDPTRLVEGDEEEEGETLHSRGLLNFSKTTFESAGPGGSSVRLDDPEFWTKVLGADARSTLLERFNKGEVTNSPQEREAFMQEVGAAAQEVIDAKLSAKPVPDWGAHLEAVLIGIAEVTGPFSEDQRSRARALMEDVERPTRRRRAAAGMSLYATASSRDLSAAIGGDDEDYEGGGKRSRSVGKGGSRRRKTGFEEVDVAADSVGLALAGEGDTTEVFSPGNAGRSDSKRIHKLVERGPKAAKRLPAAVGCTINVPLCALTFREGVDLALCDGACMRYLAPDALGISPDLPSEHRGGVAPDGKWMCTDCDSGWQRCFCCGVAGPVGVAGCPPWMDDLSSPVARAIADRAAQAWFYMANQDHEGLVRGAAEAEEREKARVKAKKTVKVEEVKTEPGTEASLASTTVEVKTEPELEAEPDISSPVAGPTAGDGDKSPTKAPTIINGEEVFASWLSAPDAAVPIGCSRPAWLPPESAERRPPAPGLPPTPSELATMSDEQFRVASQKALATTATGPDGLPQHPWSSRPVWGCSVSRCGRFFCLACIRKLALVSFASAVDPRKFRCPLHSCCKCTKGAETMPLLQSIAAPLAIHFRCLPSPEDDLFPIRLSKKFMISARHTRADEAAALARRRIHVHNAGMAVAGALGEKDALAGQAGNSKLFKKGTCRHAHPMTGPFADQPPKRPVKRPRKRLNPAAAQGQPEGDDFDEDGEDDDEDDDGEEEAPPAKRVAVAGTSEPSVAISLKLHRGDPQQAAPPAHE
jgi:superfamily II DNA or RNA helicase